MTGERGEASTTLIGAVSSVLSGAARDVIQARDVHGGVHFYNLGAAPPMPCELPADVHQFVGREVELERLAAALDEQRAGVLVVTGTAGAGKTALIVRLAHIAKSRYPDGQLFVNLRGYDPGPALAPGAVLERMLRTLGIAPQEIPIDLEERARLYRSLLSGRRMMVVLDNAATVGQVRPLLPGEPGCLVLVTSRGRVSGLTARDGAFRLSLGLLDGEQSVALVSAVTAGHRLGDDPSQMMELARLCANLPLALRVAAERAASRPWLALSDLNADLRDESTLWHTLSTEDGEEVDTVRAVFAWSYRALPPTAARAFRRLGLHPGPSFEARAAAALIGETPERTRSLLDLLAGAHLLEQNSASRYQLHDLLRAYALSRVRAEESEQHRSTALTRLAGWYVHGADAAARAYQKFFPSVLAEQPDPAMELPVFGSRDDALHWHRAEQANLLALVRATAAAGLDRLTWQLSATLHALHVAHGPMDDWLEIGTTALDAARRLDNPQARALIHETLGTANKAAGDMEQAAAQHVAALELRSALGDQAGVNESTHSLGLVHLQRRALTPARTCFEQSLAFAREQRNHAWVAAALCCLAFTSAEQGDLETAARQAAEALALHRNHDTDPHLQLDPMLMLARVHRESGCYSDAEATLKQAEAIVARSDHPALEHAALLEHADLAYARGHSDQALELYLRYIHLRRFSSDRRMKAYALNGIGRTLRALDRLDEAIEFHRTAARYSRRPLYRWQLAVSLCDLAEAWQDVGRSDQARTAHAEADALLAYFTDPRADALRVRPRRRHDE